MGGFCTPSTNTADVLKYFQMITNVCLILRILFEAIVFKGIFHDTFLARSENEKNMLDYLFK